MIGGFLSTNMVNIVVELTSMKPQPLAARLQNFLSGLPGKVEFWRTSLKGLVLLALAVELMAVALTIAGIPARWRELDGRNVPIAWITNYTLIFEIMLAAVFFITAAVILYYRRVDGLAVFLSLALVVLGATETGMTGALISPDWNPGGIGWRGVVYALRSLSMGAALLLLYVFPDGRITPGWARPLAAIWIVLNVVWFFFPRVPFNPNDGPTWRATPLLSMAFGVAWFSSGILAQILRYRRTTDPLTRLQTKWTAAGMIAAVLGTTLYYGLLVDYNSSYLLHLGDAYFAIRPPLQTISVSLFPICLGVAVLRFRLWDINIIIRRALVYASLTILVAGVYVLVVGGLGVLLEAQGSLWIALAATALVAVIFHPLRERIQSGVDRLMYGERRNPYQVISELGQRLESTLNPDAVLPAIVETVAAALKLPYAAILLRQKEDEPLLLAYGSPPVQSEALVELPLTYQGVELGQLRVSPRSGETSLSPNDKRLLGDLARQAGVAVHAALVTSALRQAHERLVSAREEERRRLRRDLHDGLGPRLASQALTLDVIARQIRSDPQGAGALLQVLSKQTQQSVAEIRELINGLRPPALDDLGLGNALQEMAGELTQAGEEPQITVQIFGSLDDLPAAIEVAAYRIAQEALTNVIKHAQASECHTILRVETPLVEERSVARKRHSQVLILEITDNGRGIPDDFARGVGLGSMKERAAEVGGRLAIEPHPGGGTRLHAELPVSREGIIP